MPAARQHRAGVSVRWGHPHRPRFDPSIRIARSELSVAAGERARACVQHAVEDREPLAYRYERGLNPVDLDQPGARRAAGQGAVEGALTARLALPPNLIVH